MASAAAGKKGKEIIVSCRHEPGAGAAILGALGAAKINVTAMCGYGMPEGAKVHVLCDKAAQATKALGKAGHQAEANEVVVVTVSNRPGEMAAALAKIGGAGVNLDYVYGSVVGRAGIAVLATKDIAGALKALRKK